MSKPGTLYLVPNFLGHSKDASLLPPVNATVIRSLNYFVVEELRAARQLIARMAPGTDMDALHFFLLNEHTGPGQLPRLLEPLLSGHDMGIISDAGCPAIADPGSDLVRMAQQHNLRVVPLTGPSSIVLALMASGLNGQSFVFEGYLPKEQNGRVRKIREMESDARKTGRTHIFIETPYRNNHMLEDLLATCSGETRLCVAADLQGPEESVRTHPMAQWKKQVPGLSKKPVVFLIGI
jgi:16S rRNA (cytidine1402-2'-O)-methyltransferase